MLPQGSLRSRARAVPTPSGPEAALGDPVARASAIIGLIGVATVHLAQVVPTIDQTPYLGASFVLLTVACVALAGGVLVADRAAVWALVGVVNLLSVAGYAFTRTFSTFFDQQDVGNWSEMLGVAALLVEGLLVMLSLHQLWIGRDRYRSGGEYLGRLE
jgi:hypothetical protein